VDGSHGESHHGMRPHFVSAVVADRDLCDPALRCLVPAQATVTAGSSGHAAPASSDATYSASAATAAGAACPRSAAGRGAPQHA
jgi:hypothetical protein